MLNFTFNVITEYTPLPPRLLSCLPCWTSYD